jgi:hypothetical protein
MDIKLAFGIRDGRVIHISELTQAEKGEKCNCICPVCSGRLLAKIGNIRQRHFAHKTICNCDVVHANQTGLHRLAKEIIRSNRTILVPGFTITREEIVQSVADSSFADDLNVESFNKEASKFEYSSVEIEKTIDNIVADALVANDNKQCIIEVAVTHFVDETKRQKLKAVGIPAFEIDLSGLVDSGQTLDEINNAVISDENIRRWVFNPKRNRQFEEMKVKFFEEYDAEKKKRDMKEREEREEKEEDNNQYFHIKHREVMDTKKYANDLKRLRNDEQAARWIKKYGFAKDLSEYPFYIDIPIAGEIVFPCDRRIWQGAIFDEYVYRGFGKELCTFTTFAAIKRIKKNLLDNKEWVYQTRSCILDPKEAEDRFFWVIDRYFNYLELLGFISESVDKWISRRPKSIIPPEQNTATILKEILESVDCYSPEINKIIRHQLHLRLPEREKYRVNHWRNN